MPTHNLLYTRRAHKDIDELDILTKRRLAKKLVEFAENPLKYSEKLMNSFLGQYRFRVGDYRIVFDLHGSDIIILRVGHRREIYR